MVQETWSRWKSVGGQVSRGWVREACRTFCNKWGRWAAGSWRSSPVAHPGRQAGPGGTWRSPGRDLSVSAMALTSVPGRGLCLGPLFQMALPGSGGASARPSGERPECQAGEGLRFSPQRLSSFKFHWGWTAQIQPFFQNNLGAWICGDEGSVRLDPWVVSCQSPRCDGNVSGTCPHSRFSRMC